jgi:6-phosphogluconate dehydrogenase
MRQISAMKTERVKASSRNSEAGSDVSIHNSQFTIHHLKNALHFSFVLTYAQGLALLKTASEEKGYRVDLTRVATIWRGGCIIRAALLEDIRRAFADDKDLSNLILNSAFAAVLNEKLSDLREVAAVSAAGGFPSYCLMSCLAYYDAYHTRRLPANLIQAQRDFFGAHTYQRIDEDGTFHTPDWDTDA